MNLINSAIIEILNYRKGVVLFIIIGDVHKFIGHCLIPSAPWGFEDICPCVCAVKGNA